MIDINVHDPCCCNCPIADEIAVIIIDDELTEREIFRDLWFNIRHKDFSESLSCILTTFL